MICLPEQPTSFIGREAEVAEILSLLRDERCRLLTLVGPGGIGKSRLALKAVETMTQPGTGGAISDYWDGICFVPFESVASPGAVASTIANALDWKTYEGNDPKAELQAYLADRHFLLVLDNFEHLLPAAPLLLDILHSAPGCKLLVTSRVTLNLAQEWLFQVDGMSLPPPDGNLETCTSDALALFAERARRVRRDFSLESEWTHVARICRFVEGMPLAIELAAAWLRRMSCAEVATELDHGLGILASDQVGIPERHRTMEVVFDHSWNLLTLEERSVFMGLSVFRRGFTREAAENVFGASLPILSSLVDKSLLRLTSSGRYTIHELQRQYAAERLAEAPDLLAKANNEHSAYYLKLVARPARLRLAQDDRRLLVRFEDEIDNILAAWRWAVDHKRLADLRYAVDALYWFAWLSTYHQEISAAFQYAVETLGADTADSEVRLVYASVMASLSSMDVWMGGMPDATERLPEIIAILRALPDARPELGFAVGVLGWHTLRRLELETAKALFLEAVQIDRETEQSEILGFIYCQLGAVYAMQSHFQDSEQWYLQALTLGRRTGDHRTTTHALRELSVLASVHGDYAGAQRYLEEALQLAESKDLLSFTVTVLCSLGELAEATGDLEAASHLVEQSLD
ncbi:MAG: ATP-binding protein, partial [Caldilineaceae bacterium]